MEPKSIKAIITGGTGFVGSHLSRRLASEGWQVHVIARQSSNVTGIADLLNHITLHRHNGTTEHLYQIMEQVKPGVVFHLATYFHAQHTSKDIAPHIECNLLFGTQLLEAMKLQGISRLINTGTAWQHYQDKDYNPVCLHSATKQAFEAIIQFYVETAGFQAITLKLHDTYGPLDPRPKLFSMLLEAARSGQTLDMSPGNQLMDLVHVFDVVEAFWQAAQLLLARPESLSGSHESYVVSSGRHIRLQEIVKKFARIIGRPVKVHWGGRPYRPREVMVPWRTGNRLPGWKPSISLEDGLHALFDIEASVKQE